MIVARNTVAKLLETVPSNIEHLKQVESNVYIKLKDSEDELSMTLEEYQHCLQQLKSSKVQIDLRKFLTVFAVIGTFIYVTISAINLDIANSHNGQDNAMSIVESGVGN